MTEKMRIMMKRKKQALIYIIALCVVFMVLASGCTVPNSNQPGITPSSTTETPQPAQSEITKPAVTWKDFYPEYSEYDEQTKQKLVEEAKDEIMMLFPYVNRSTLNGQWEEHRYISRDGAYGNPVIKFENVDATSDKYLALQEKMSNGDSSGIQRNIVKIIFDPESGKILSFGPQNFRIPPEGIERIITPEEAKDKCLDFIKKVKGEDFVNNEMNRYSIDYSDFGATKDEGFVIMVITRKSYDENTSYLNGYMSVWYNLVCDEILSYADETYDPELLSALTTLSPVPDITLEEAREIFETKVAESYPGEVISYITDEDASGAGSLVWDNIPKNIYSDDPEPFRLVWYMEFAEDNSLREAVIDAHTGDIIYLKYKDIDIDVSD